MYCLHTRLPRFFAFILKFSTKITFLITWHPFWITFTVQNLRQNVFKIASGHEMRNSQSLRDGRHIWKQFWSASCRTHWGSQLKLARWLAQDIVTLSWKNHEKSDVAPVCIFFVTLRVHARPVWQQNRGGLSRKLGYMQILNILFTFKKSR